MNRFVKDNRGQITVFLCLLVGVLLGLILFSIRVANLKIAESQFAMCTKSTVSGALSRYNQYLFEQYHILAFDRMAHGEGEGAMEEEMLADLEENLSNSVFDPVDVKEVAVTNYKSLTEQDCTYFKEQIQEYLLYAAVDYGLESLLGKTDGQNGEISEDIWNDMDQAAGDPSQNSIAFDVEFTDETSEQADPREFTKKLTQDGIMSLVVPKSIEYSEKLLATDNLPSKTAGIHSEDTDVDKKFDNMLELKSNLAREAGWKEALLSAGAGPIYARLCFNCATNYTKNSETVLHFEEEYLIAGKTNDRKNLQSVVLRISLLRFPVNFVFLLKDAEKVAELTAFSDVLMMTTGIPASILKYLLAGCWSYVESLADVKVLLNGNKIPFTKNAASWWTNLKKPEESLRNLREANGTETDDSTGLCYEDYLMILHAVEQKKIYYRMLDLMQENARLEDQTFWMQNAACGLGVDFSGSLNGKEINLHQVMQY